MTELVPELVPRKLWGISAKRLLSKARWASIRAAVIEESGGVCRACEDRPQAPQCNECWVYCDGVATLVGLEILCAACHNVVHIGRAKRLGFLDEAIAKLCLVNRIGEGEAWKMVKEAFSRWEAMNEIDSWRIEVAPELGRRFPDLLKLRS